MRAQRQILVIPLSWIEPFAGKASITCSQEFGCWWSLSTMLLYYYVCWFRCKKNAV